MDIIANHEWRLFKNIFLLLTGGCLWLEHREFWHIETESIHLSELSY